MVDGEPVWRPEPIEALLRRPRTAPLFVQGTVANRGRWYSRFAAVVLLTAPVEVLLHRVRGRHAGEYGASAADRARIRYHAQTVEPLLRAGATHVLDTRSTPAEVVDALVRIVEITTGSAVRSSP